MADGEGTRAGAKITHNDLLRTGPGTLAGRYLRSFWQPVYRSADIAAGHARPVHVLGEDFTLYRTADGTPHVVAERCPHRGAKLSLGRVNGDSLACAYHGWTFDPGGRCLAQPAEPRPFCDKVAIRTYPTREQVGLIFAYLGEDVPPAFAPLPEFEDARFTYHVRRSHWPCNYWAQMENTFDVTHTNFLHPQFNYHTPEQWKVEETAYGLKLWTPGLSGIEGSYDTHYLHMPNVQEFMTAPKPGERVGFITRSWRIPYDDESFLRFDLRFYPVVGAEADALRGTHTEQAKTRATQSIPEMASAVLRGEVELDELVEKHKLGGSDLIGVQDCAVMASLSPMASRPQDDMLGQSDIGIAWLRRLWTHELQAFAAGTAVKQWDRSARLWEAAMPR
jgi:5,5'-dehydrodivanillate O-demethylase oxygenase subunit